MRTVLASWNVHGWIGADRIRDPVRCFDAIRRLDADVVALQEAEGRDWEPLARAAGYETLHGPTLERDCGSEYGNALLHRVATARVRRIDLTVPGREPRGALDVVFDAHGDRLRVVTTHLGLRASERRRQAARLAERIARDDAELPVALIGDLNDWTPWAGQLGAIARRIGPLSRIPTFPSRRPVLALDRACWRVPGSAAHLRAERERAFRLASDHLPLRLALEAGDAPRSLEADAPRPGAR